MLLDELESSTCIGSVIALKTDEGRMVPTDD
jgi:hypothetical protein